LKEPPGYEDRSGGRNGGEGNGDRRSA